MKTTTLADLYTDVLAANRREILDQDNDLKHTDPVAWKARQRATDDVWNRFGRACRAAGLSIAEGIEAATADGWMGPEGITYPSKNAFYDVMAAGGERA